MADTQQPGARPPGQPPAGQQPPAQAPSQAGPQQPRGASHAILTAKGCPPAQAAQIASQCDPQTAQKLADLAASAQAAGFSFNWQGAFELLTQYGPAVITAFLKLLGR